MVDNLRRTLSAPATFLTSPSPGCCPVTSPAVWSAFVLVTRRRAAAAAGARRGDPRRRGISKRSPPSRGRDAILAASHVGLTLAMLAYQAG